MSSRICPQSGIAFEVTAQDLAFYEKASPQINGQGEPLPAPTLAPQLRAMRRAAWRNSNNLYRRRCDLSGQSVISGYPADAPYPIYATERWWGDSWNPLASGAEFDFQRPFFEQFQELMWRAPRPALMNRDAENSEYCNYAGENKNCYMANNGSWYNQGCLFGEAYLHCIDCLDCSYLRKSELCYSAICSEQLYDCAFIANSFNSANCYFSFNLRSCQDCFLCSNLRNKRGYILNKPASSEAIARLRQMMRTAEGLAELQRRYGELYTSSLHPATQQINCEECSGEYLANSKNVTESYLVGSIRDGRFLIHCDEGNDMWDCCLSGYGNTELYLETVSSGAGGRHAMFCSGSWGSSEVLYCDTVMSCKNCFGCVGLQRQEYCILNKQFSKEGYFERVAQIIQHMRKTGEWGEFFPASIAPHAYNESAASDFYPLEREEALRLGYRWREATVERSEGELSAVPASIDLATDDTSEQTFVCSESDKRFRIPRAELALLRKFGIAPSWNAPELRRVRRGRARNQPQLWSRACAECGETITTSFAPARAERVGCERCYRRLLFS